MRLPPHRSWGSMASSDVADFVARDPVVVLPLAAIEQHGPHLPLSTDLDIGEGILESALRELPEEVPARVLPTLAFGASTEHMRLAGTVALSSEEMAGAIRRVGAGVAGSGVRRLVLWNSHGGNRPAMESAALDLRRTEGLLVVKVSWPRLPRPDGVGLPDAEWRHGIHGGAIETSMMLHLRPDIVSADVITQCNGGDLLGRQLEDRLTHIGPEGPVSFAWLAEDLHPSGIAGDPSLADAATGERLVRHYGKILAQVVRDARAFPLERLRGADGPG